jgi:peptidoglycan/LPS O-acetylase OafA/YrhL
VIVLISHVLYTKPEIAATVYDPRSGKENSLIWWITYTPAHLFWDGTAAVYLFFVLSGFALTWPMLSSGRPTWRVYYPRRFIRLYLPVWASVLAGLGWLIASPRHARAQGGEWLNEHTKPIGLHQVLGDLLLFPSPGAVNGVLWSLKAEIAFSLLLPVYLLVVIRRSSWWLGKAILIVALVSIGAAANQPAMMMLPMFALGSLMAAENDRLKRLSIHLSNLLGPRAWGWYLLASSAAMINIYWILVGLSDANATGTTLTGIGRGAQIIGAATLVFVVAFWPSAEPLGTGRIPQWLGSRSYSLYLVQEPIVVSIAMSLSAPANIAVVGICSVTIVLTVTELFHRFVERPSHRWSRRIGTSTLLGTPSARTRCD